MTADIQPKDTLQFWFEELTDKQHFAKDAALDNMIRKRFGPSLEAAARCELYAWRATPEGALAEIIVLDQFSRKGKLGSDSNWGNWGQTPIKFF